MMLRRTLALSLITGTTMALVPWAAARADDGVSLPVRQITLYRSGVGYFEHAGKVRGDATVRLRFETDDINDILKSMALMDLGGGKIGTVSYGSKEPLERRLASFGVDITRANNLGELLQQLRGAGLSVETNEGTIEGTILGVEHRPTNVNDTVVNQMFVNLVTPKGIKSVNTAYIRNFELLDETLAEELGLALGALAEQRAERLKTVDLRFLADGNDGDRTVVVSYVHEMPVWKTSYRLVLPESAAPDSKPRIQGWAIVENTTDADWNDVRLSLASGRPVSFTMDLYEPIFMQRPSVPVPVLANVVSRVYEAGKMMAKNVAGAPAAEADARFAYADRARATRGQHSESAVADGEVIGMASLGIGSQALGQSDATGEQVGGQFMYTVDTPVSLERQRSAMLPILTSDIKGRRVSIYNAADNAKNPMRGVQLTNDSGLHLMPGPISVYDAGTYAGDAQIPHTSRDQTRLMGYAVDLDVQAQTKQEWDTNMVRIRIVDGVIDQQVKQRRSIEYSFENNDADALRTMLVEHPRMGGWELVSPAKPAEELEQMYRFEMPIPAGGENSMKVIEENISSQRIAISSYDMETLLSYSRQGKASQAVVDAIAKAARMQSDINTLERRLNELDRERDEIARDQNRVRDNMNRIDRNSDLYRRYMQKLNDQEDRLEQILVSRDTSQTELENARKALNDYLRDLDVN